MNEQNVVIPYHPAETNNALTPMDMLSLAVTKGADIAVLEKLMALHERWEAGQARKAFDAAVAAAKGEIPAIVKNREVDFSTGKGRTSYAYEDLAGIARIVDPILFKHGLSYRFRADQDGQRLSVTCVLSHRDGYSEATTLQAAEDHSGNKNSIQAIGSATTYLQRYTLKLALGLSTTKDDDGQSYGAGSEIDRDELTGEGRRIVTEEGMAALGLWWTKTLSKDERKALGTAALEELKKLGVN